MWVVVAKDISTGEYHVFKDLQEQENVRRLLDFWKRVSTYIGHNWLEYDYPVIVHLLGNQFRIPEIATVSYDTLVLSRLFDYSRLSHSTPEAEDFLGEGSGYVAKRTHSIESYGDQFGLPKGKFNDWSKYSEEMLEYCRRDVDICELIYRLYLPRISDVRYQPSIRLEQEFQLVVNDLHSNGFFFNHTKANKLLVQVEKELGELDAKIKEAFPAKLSLVREITPRITKHGTLHRQDFRWLPHNDLSEFNGGPFCRCEWKEFNPSSHRQIVEVLNKAGWKPLDKTATHIEFDRGRVKDEDRKSHLLFYGWKVNENNLSTLPSTAPAPSKLLAKRILLESRRRTLTEWLALVGKDGRIHGKFYGIGAWTHRMAHQRPNTANIPNDLDTQGNKKLLGKEMRSLWCAPKNRLLVGVDAEGIQLRIFAHYIDDKEFTDALVRGQKSSKTDPHSLNQRILGSVCKSRAAAKRFIYALLLGAGIWKLSQVLECSETECKEALDRLLQRYHGWKRLREKDIPRDAKRGFFEGLDGRKVSIPGASLSERKHLAMSGYLQNGEAVIMKKATLKFLPLLPKGCKLVNLVHDEWQTEVPNNMEIALQVAKIQALSLKEVGEELNLRCPLAGSYFNDDIRDYTIGTNWSVTH